MRILRAVSKWAVLAVFALGLAGCQCMNHRSRHGSRSAPVIVMQPEDLTVTNGAPARFQISVSPSAGLLYQWRCNGTNVTLPSTNPVLSIASATVTNVGFYRCIVSRTNSPSTTILKSQRAGLTIIGEATTGSTPIVVPVTGPLLLKKVSGSGCPGGYVGYVKYKDSTGSYWWPPPQPAAPDSPYTSVTLRDVSTYPSPYDTRVVIVENLKPASPRCGPKTGVTLSPLTSGAKYSFTIYVKAGAPASGSPITANFVWE